MRTKYTVLLCALVVMLVASAAASSAPGPAPIAAPTTCGQPVVYKKADPDGALAKLPPNVRKWYDSYPFEVRASPWASFKGSKGPWKIGYISFPIANAFKIGYYNELKQEFAKAKAAGLVTGKLQTFIQPAFNTATPEQQSAAISQMVSSGVDAIILHPLNAVAVTPAIDEAGRAGVPVILTGDVAPTSKYAINTLTENQSQAFATVLKQLVAKGWFKGETRTVLDVQGIAGNSFSEQVHQAALATLKACKGVKIVGTVYGQWNSATTKSEVLKFLASHPGKLDFVMHEGAMAAGIIQAFESLGRSVPPMPISGNTGGDLSWWLAHKDAYNSAAVFTMGGRQVAYTTFRLALRVLAGKGLKVRDIAPPGLIVTSANIAKYAVPGKSVSWVENIHWRGSLDSWLSNRQMDLLFTKPGSPGGS